MPGLKRSRSIRFPTLRFRAKIMLGFAVVLAISAASMGFAYLGFERVSDVVDCLPAQRAGGRSGARHRSRADLLPRAGPLFRGDRQGRGRQGRAGRRSPPEGCHPGLDEGHHQSGPARAGRQAGAGIPHLHQDFRRHRSSIKDESARIAQNQLARTGNSLRYKLDDLPSNAEDEEMQSITLGAKKVTEQFQATIALANSFVVNSRQVGRHQRAGAAEIRRESALKGDPSTTNAKILGRHQGNLRACWRNTARSLAKLVGERQGDRRPDRQEMTEIGCRDQQGLGGDEVGSAGGSEAARRRIGRRPSAKPNG